jgi:hypothetical protein
MYHLMLGAPKVLTRIVLGLGLVAGKLKLTKHRLGQIFEFGDIGKFHLLIPLIKPSFLSCNITGIIK